MRRLFCALFALLLLLSFGAGLAASPLAAGMVKVLPARLGAPPAQVLHSPQPQSIDWQEQRTSYFAILYAPGDTHVATYAGFVDGIYDELATLFSHKTDTPLTIKLYPTQEAYFQATPQAAQYPGIVAHADFRRRELVVVLPLTDQQSAVEVENNIRHELTHLIAAELSENRLNIGFQEGIAQYVEHPAGELETRVKLLEQALNDGRLLSWADMDERDKVYGAPEVGYPQALSMVAFLMDRGGFGSFRDFLEVSGRSSGFRSALERAYGASADALEQEWRDWLPGYIAGGYRRSAVNSYDLSVARELLGQGRYAEAQTELEQAVQWLESNPDAAAAAGEVANEAQQLLAQSKRGQEAEQAAANARAALEVADYAGAQQLVDRASAAYAAIGDTRQDEVLAAFGERAKRGNEAIATLDAAVTQARALRYPDARRSAERAAAEFDALGDASRANQARALITSLDSRQRLLGMTLLAVGLMGVVGSLWGRTRWREAEVW